MALRFPEQRLNIDTAVLNAVQHLEQRPSIQLHAPDTADDLCVLFLLFCYAECFQVFLQLRDLRYRLFLFFQIAFQFSVH